MTDKLRYYVTGHRNDYQPVPDNDDNDDEPVIATVVDQGYESKYGMIRKY